MKPGEMKAQRMDEHLNASRGQMEIEQQGESRRQQHGESLRGWRWTWMDEQKMKNMERVFGEVECSGECRWTMNSRDMKLSVKMLKKVFEAWVWWDISEKKGTKSWKKKKKSWMGRKDKENLGGKNYIFQNLEKN